MDNPTFFELYCERTGVPRSAFVIDLFRRTIYPHARPFIPPLKAVNPYYFVPDYNFIENVSAMRQPEQFASAVRSFLQDPANASFLRRRLRLRISVRRMVTVVTYVRSPNLPSDLMLLLRSNGTQHPFWREESTGPSPGEIDRGASGLN